LKFKNRTISAYTETSWEDVSIDLFAWKVKDWDDGVQLLSSLAQLASKKIQRVHKAVFMFCFFI